MLLKDLKLFCTNGIEMIETLSKNLRGDLTHSLYFHDNEFCVNYTYDDIIFDIGVSVDGKYSYYYKDSKVELIKDNGEVSELDKDPMIEAFNSNFMKQ